ncbi:hypothetical protein JOEDIRT_122 [Mycobacterium phage JoeDirt]|uniref:Uncharacterized protein n=2 Tax=Mycobacterium virus JoeDirt TaxID=1034137 RepID=G1BQP2_9CAUD|nr:hypothetical protein FGG55_gp116 [Mycobacterium phage JoeDirt]AEK07141.1 hypothetical protein JOEDIRT_122 [Mycobacterium phage JoeDirt]AYD82286.1 hypothetical protein SEA_WAMBURGRXPRESS_122 [Mycobacterium phage Wamburgrxpress]
MDCLEGPEGCAGDVFMYEALSGSGERYPRCERHYAEYYARVWPKMEETRKRYPDTDTPPDWFDPTYAGERWNEDD